MITLSPVCTRPPAGNIRQLGIDSPIKILSFDQSNAGGIIRAPDNRSVGGIAGRQSGDDGGFEIVRRRNVCRLNLRLLSHFPVVVGEKQPSRVIELKALKSSGSGCSR
jgi:hypothetical protein